MEIGIQGVAGSFHDQAASGYFHTHDLVFKEFNSFRSLAKSIQAQEVDYGVMAIENTIAGSILPNYALINEYDLHIAGEIYSRIELTLMAHAGVNVDDLDQVFSHPMALLQSADYLSKYPKIKITEFEDTADSARMIKEKGLKFAGAIASKRAAEIFGLEVLETNVETNKANYTRFLILSGRMNGVGKTKEKASLRIVTKHDPGSLSDVLLAFKENNINLTKIQSMPILGEPYRYAFHIDVVWDNYEEYQKALEVIRRNVVAVKVHGEYEKGNFPIV